MELESAIGRQLDLTSKVARDVVALTSKVNWEHVELTTQRHPSVELLSVLVTEEFER